MIFTQMYVHVRDPHTVRSRSLTATRLGFRSCDLFLFRILGSSLVLLSQLSLYYFTYRAQLDIQARIHKFFKGGLRSKILKEKCLLIHVSTRVHIKTRQTCKSFSLLPFQEDCLLFFALFYYSLLLLKFERGQPQQEQFLICVHLYLQSISIHRNISILISFSISMTFQSSTCMYAVLLL